MTPRRTFTLHNAAQGHQVLTRAWEHCKPWLLAGHKLVITVAPATRSSDQNARLHAILGDVARQVVWSGKRRDTDTWKRLMTAAWLRARGEPVEFLPAIDGAGVDVVFRKTSTLTVAECGELMEFIEAWGSEHGVAWTEPAREEQTA